MLQQLESLRDQARAANETAKEALQFHNRICNGEVLNAAFFLFGHTSTSNLSKAELYRQLCEQFPLVFAFARKRIPDLPEETFMRMLMEIDPCPENPWISGRNITANKISIAQARASAARQGEDEDVLQRWIDLLAADEKNSQKSLDEIAFLKRLLLTPEGLSKLMTGSTFACRDDEIFYR